MPAPNADRFGHALRLHEAETATTVDLAQAVVDAQREIHAEGGGTRGVYADPAVRLLVRRLYQQGGVAEFEEAYGAKEEAMQQALQGSTHASSVALLRDGLSAVQGAVNVGAMMNSLVRHATALRAEGHGEPIVARHDGTAAILMQCASLCRVRTRLNSDDPDGDLADVVQACRAAVARQAAQAVITVARSAP